MNNVASESWSSGSRMTPDAGISLGLGLTNECNLSCSFCYRDPTRVDRLSLEQVTLHDGQPAGPFGESRHRRKRHAPGLSEDTGVSSNSASETHHHFQWAQRRGP